MKISVSVSLEKDETLAYTPDAAATQVLAALGGNPTEDYCEVYVYAPTEPGEAGVPPPPMEAPA
jgi:hypothetical protein